MINKLELPVNINLENLEENITAYEREIPINSRIDIMIPGNINYKSATIVFLVHLVKIGKSKGATLNFEGINRDIGSLISVYGLSDYFL